jgi:hypothetical protein
MWGDAGPALWTSFRRGTEVVAAGEAEAAALPESRASVEEALADDAAGKKANDDRRRNAPVDDRGHQKNEECDGKAQKQRQQQEPKANLSHKRFHYGILLLRYGVPTGMKGENACTALGEMEEHVSSQFVKITSDTAITR